MTPQFNKMTFLSCFRKKIYDLEKMAGRQSALRPGWVKIVNKGKLYLYIDNAESFPKIKNNQTKKAFFKEQKNPFFKEHKEQCTSPESVKIFVRCINR